MKKHKPIVKLRPEDAQKQFASYFEKIAYRRTVSEVFTDFIDYAVLMLNINKSPEDFRDLEKRYPSKEEHIMFFQMFELMATASIDFTDALGDLFMDLVSHGHNGQFFTPQPICDMMSIMTIAPDQLEDGKSVLDCACGSGRMLLAAAKRNRNLKFYGSDLDLTCVKMTLINMILNTMIGEVAHMDALTLQHFKTYSVRKVYDPGTNHYLPYYYESNANPFIIQKIKESNVKESDELKPNPVEELLINKKGQILLF